MHCTAGIGDAPKIILICITYSLHWINDSGFSKAVAQYLDEERRAVGREMEILSDYGPFKDLNLEERK